MNSTKRTAHLAGVIYLIVVLSGIFSLIYVPSQLIEWKDPSITFSNIQASETLFRFGILSGLICYTAFLVLPLALYKFLNKVDKTYAILMVVFAIVSIPMSFVNQLNYMDILVLISDTEYLKVVDQSYLHSQVMLSLEAHYHGNLIAQIFWGLWLFPFGYLVYKSGFLPKILGIFLMIGCFGYLIDFCGSFLFSGYHDTIIPTVVGIPDSIGEIGICLWLLIMGVNKTASNSDNLKQATI